jgi:hypothetical protein
MFRVYDGARLENEEWSKESWAAMAKKASTI